MALDDRLRWLFPELSEQIAGQESQGLDPSTEDGRTLLIEAYYRERAATTGSGSEEFVVNGSAVSPQLLVALHSMVANQICEDNPPEAWLTAQRLTSDGHGHHEVLDMLTSVASIEVQRVLTQHMPFDLDAYVAALDALPELPEPDHADHDHADHDHADHDHADHDHADHDHAGHDHAGHDHAGAQGSEDLPEPDDLDYVDDLDDPDDLDDLDDPDDPDDLDDPDESLAELLEMLAEHGPLTTGEAAQHLGVDEDKIEVLASNPLVVSLADKRIASALALLGGTVFTHRLSAHEVDEQVLVLSSDTGPILRGVCGFSHVHLADGELAYLSSDTDDLRIGAGTELEASDGWLGGATEGQLVGMKMTLLDVDERDATGCVATLEVLANPGEPSVPEGFGAQLAASLAVFGDGNGVPTRVDYLLCQLAADAPGLMGAVLAPVSELLLDAGLEERQGHAGRPGTDWEAFEWLQEVAHVAAGGDLDRDTSEALIAICRLNRSYQLGALKELDRDFAGVVAQALQDDELAEAFAGVAKVTHSAPTTLGFLNQVRGLAKTAHRASVAWTESLVCGADGQHERAEECLRFALLADPDHPGALEDTAWYASDRGDPGTALRYLLRREGDDLDERRISLLRHFSPDKSSRGGPGRNAPCDCGSGRKFKHCCLASANQGAVTPLPARTWWLWDKLTWWLSRTGRLPELYEIAMVLSAGEDHDIAQAELDVDVAVSLVLFQDGAVSEFLEQRAPLLPADEVALVRRWANEPRSLYEVVGVASGGSVTARDLRTDQSVVASHRYRAAKPGVGDVIFAHAAFDGSGHQFLGGIVQIPEGLAQTLLSGLDQRASGWSIAVILGEIRRRASVRPHG